MGNALHREEGLGLQVSAAQFDQTGGSSRGATAHGRQRRDALEKMMVEVHAPAYMGPP